MRASLVGTLFAALACAVASADPLSSADREALLEQLESLSENAESKVDARYRAAIQAYDEALASNEAAIEFYLKCVEKVDFLDRDRKNADFREWKRREADRLSDAGYRLALRYQLRWLTLCLKAASSKADRPRLASEARQVVDSLFDDAVELKGWQNTLGENVTGTVFARAYEIGGLPRLEWPLAPSQIAEFYEKVVFPPLRSPARLDELRAAWNRRVTQESLRVEHWQGGGGGERKNGPGAAEPNEAYQNFTTETLPELKWQMETDLFRAGDEGGSAKRMLAHLTQHLGHRSARAWGEQFRQLLRPKGAPTAATEPAPAP